MTQETPGGNLQQHLAALGLTKTELARRLGVSQGYISRLVTGDKPISLELATRIAEVTGAPRVSYLTSEQRALLRGPTLEPEESHNQDRGGSTPFEMIALGVIDGDSPFLQPGPLGIDVGSGKGKKVATIDGGKLQFTDEVLHAFRYAIPAESNTLADLKPGEAFRFVAVLSDALKPEGIPRLSRLFVRMVTTAFPVSNIKLGSLVVAEIDGQLAVARLQEHNNQRILIPTGQPGVSYTGKTRILGQVINYLTWHDV